MLRRLQTLKKESQGFTIIEVLIVLAIAALILVIVLVAIPQLQRNQRNTARQDSAARLLTAVQNWSANNNGAVFTAGGAGNPNIAAVINDVGTLDQYVLSAVSVPPNPDVTATNVQPAMTTLANLVIVTGATCAANGATTGGTSKQVAIQFAAENSGAASGRCISS
jgi:prepilin-type N-terminal cleavage/methylation domain-containing protein